MFSFFNNNVLEGVCGCCDVSHCVLLHVPHLGWRVKFNFVKRILRHLCSVALRLSFKLPRAAFPVIFFFLTVMANVTLPQFYCVFFT